MVGSIIMKLYLKRFRNVSRRCIFSSLVPEFSNNVISIFVQLGRDRFTNQFQRPSIVVKYVSKTHKYKPDVRINLGMWLRYLIQDSVDDPLRHVDRYCHALHEWSDLINYFVRQFRLNFDRDLYIYRLFYLTKYQIILRGFWFRIGNSKASLAIRCWILLHILYEKSLTH